MILTNHHYNCHDCNTSTIFGKECLIRNIFNLNCRQKELIENYEGPSEGKLR